MKRKEFFSNICKAGLCSCAGLTFLSGTNIFAQTEDEVQKELNGKIGFVQRRFTNLLEILDSSMDAESKEKIITQLGHECAKESKDYYLKHKNNPEAFLKEMEQSWAESAEYDKKNNSIKILGKQKDKCGCSLVDHSITPKEFCNCSRGWFEEVLSTVLGKPVNVEILESILRGGKRCTFSIKIS